MNYDTIEKQYNIKLDDVQKDALNLWRVMKGVCA